MSQRTKLQRVPSRSAPPPRARQLSGTRLKLPVPRGDSSENEQLSPGSTSSRLTLIPPSDGEVGAASLPQLAALNAGGATLLAELELESLEQDFLNREPTYSAPSAGPPTVDASPVADVPVPRGDTRNRRLLALVLLGLPTLFAIWLWLRP